MLRTFVRDSAIYAIPSIFSRGLALILIPLYTRILSPADYGSFDLLSAFAGLVNLTVALEVSQGLARYYSDENDTGRKIAYASSAFWFAVFCYTVFLGVAFLFEPGLSPVVMGQEGKGAEFQVGVIYIYANGIFYLVQNQFRWELRAGHYAIVSLLVTIVTAVLTVILAYVLGWGLFGLLVGMAGGALLGCLYGLWYLRRSFRFRFQWERLKQMLAFSLPLVPSGIAVFAGQYIDRIMINHYLSLDEVGLFGVGFRVASITGLAIVGFQGALTPLVYAHHRDPSTPHDLARIFRIFVAFSLLLFLLVSVFAREIVTVLTVPAYYEAASIVVFLVPAILLANMYIFAPGTAIEKKTYIILWINVLGAVLNVMLNALMIPAWGIQGAAIAKFLSYGAVFGAYMVYSQKLYPVPHDWKSLAGAALLVGAVAYWLPQIEPAPEARIAIDVAGLALGMLIVLRCRLIRVSELQKLRDMVWKRFYTERS